MLVVDTNVLVYAVHKQSEFRLPCAALLAKLRTQASPWYLTWNVVYEFVRVTTHPKVFARPLPAAQALKFIEDLLASPAANMLLPTERHTDVLKQTLAELPHLRGNIVHDTQTAVLMREHGIKQIVTRDTDFHKFPFLAVVDPLAG